MGGDSQMALVGLQGAALPALFPTGPTSTAPSQQGLQPPQPGRRE